MDSKDHENSGTTGESPAYPGRPDSQVSASQVPEYQVFEYHGHEHTTTVSQLGKDPECREALDRLYHYLDGELTESRRQEIKEHLDSCLPCLEAFDFEAELKMLIARRCRDEVPDHLRIRVIQAIAEASVGRIGDESGKAGNGGTPGVQR